MVTYEEDSCNANALALALLRFAVQAHAQTSVDSAGLLDNIL
ncbi:hypothetical protein [Xylella fastidiosa]|uniref:Uncharacterized protein n=1 Tax=Xylella fastidiosa (strain 9a5c) TaxID=160492 RepID=Q9PCY9_XYLFA|nr:hypothetical protein [Xylella fastidiosa]AAF84424.1 hypothetical protein XF_1615 [Xylella fastidiosa 9a5c]ETE31786.1 hypothetical protein B398_06900 [Xylella fastidiosa 32]MDG5825276.1 hypothetical protein [Xylella fastidiosa subsp. pauca]WGZ31169.1 hypothetical protein O4444_06430 [Xylella fastidiosa subsp. pauca]WGZ35170.1 hypothetical protein O4445_04625 [Xylella fastidiosa subsp. pauca]